MWVVDATPRPCYPRERPGTHCVGCWVGPRADLDGCGKSRPPTGIRSADLPGRSESLYRMSYPDPLYRYLQRSKMMNSIKSRRNTKLKKNNKRCKVRLRINLPLLVTYCFRFIDFQKTGTSLNTFLLSVFFNS